LKVLVIATNRNTYPAPVFPYGACIVGEAAAAAGHRVRLLDLMFRRRPLRDLAGELRRFPPDVVGLSVRNLDNNDMQAPAEFVRELAAVVRVIKSLTPAPLVLGGPAVGVMPEALLRLTGAACAVLGDGETAFPALLAAWGNGGGLARVPRLAWLEDGRYRESSRTPCPLPESALAPWFPRWLNLKAYRAHQALAPIQSKRGCPFACIYCTYGISEGQEYRLFPPREVAAAVRRLADAGYRDLEFVDNVFNSPYDQALAVCRSLAETRHRARLITLELNPAFVDEPLLDAMEAAGFVGIGLTAESAADPPLDGLKKGYTAAQVERAARAVRQSRLPCLWLFMLGGPGETRETVAETLRFARRALRPGDVAYFNVGIRIYPGTALESLARREGVLTAPVQEMLHPVFYFNPGLDYAWTLEQVRRAVREDLSLLHAGSLSHPWLPAVNRLFHRLPLPKPMWRHTRHIRRVVRALGRDI
jgi:radical SAM superfamily enzyme YgiQ (UPF0313 family)